MKTGFVSSLRAFWRGQTPMRRPEMLRAALSAVACVGFVGLFAQIALARGPFGGLFLIAPIGASVVLMFAIPASPLAQPRAVIGGNLVGAVVGLACGVLIPWPVVAVPAGVGLALLAMLSLRCMHPPAGSIALAAAMAGGALAWPTLLHVLAPVAACSALAVAAACVILNLTGHSYPHHAQKAPIAPATYSRADLEAALAHYGDTLDVSADDLDALFRQVEAAAAERARKATSMDAAKSQVRKWRDRIAA